MALETELTLLLMAGVVGGFFVLHGVLRRLPFTELVPREQYRWPVWNWYALVVVSGLLFALTANLYWNHRIPRRVHPHDMVPAYTHDARKPVNDPDPKGVILDSREIRRVSGRDRPAPTPSATPAE